MAEREDNLRRTPDDLIQSPLSLTERLILAYQGLQNLTQAQSYYSQVGDTESRVSMAVNIANTQVVMGIKPDQTLTGLFSMVDALDDRKQAQVFRQVAMIEARSGNIGAAFRSIDNGAARDKSWLLPYGYIDVAKIQLAQGTDPTESINKSLESVDPRENPMSAAYQYTEIAVLQSRAGINSRSLIDRAVEIIDTSDVDRRLKPHNYQGAAEAYAANGDFGLAFQLIPRMIEDLPGKTRETREATMVGIADELIKAGRFEEARDTVWGIDNYTIIARVNASIARVMVERGVDATSQIDQVIEYLKVAEHLAKGDHYEDHYRAELGPIFAEIAQAQAKMGIDATSMFDLSIAKVVAHPNMRRRMELLRDIGKTQTASGHDARQTFILALEAADGLFEDQGGIEPDTTEMAVQYAIIEQVLDYKEIAEWAINSGVYDLVKIVFEKLDKVQAEHSIEVTEGKVELLLKHARAVAKKGLSTDEISNLSVEDMQAILSSDNETARQAALYFGLDKRVT